MLATFLYGLGKALLILCTTIILYKDVRVLHRLYGPNLDPIANKPELELLHRELHTPLCTTWLIKEGFLISLCYPIVYIGMHFLWSFLCGSMNTDELFYIVITIAIVIAGPYYQWSVYTAKVITEACMEIYIDSRRSDAAEGLITQQELEVTERAYAGELEDWQLSPE